MLADQHIGECLRVLCQSQKPAPAFLSLRCVPLSLTPVTYEQNGMKDALATRWPIINKELLLTFTNFCKFPDSGYLKVEVT